MKIKFKSLAITYSKAKTFENLTIKIFMEKLNIQTIDLKKGEYHPPGKKEFDAC